MVTVDDIAGAVAAVLAANSGFTSSVPGKAWFDRAPDTPSAYPYAVFTIERKGEAEYSSDGSYIQEWTLRLAAYSRQGTDNASTVQGAIAACLNADPAGLLSLSDGGKILHILPGGFDGTFDPKLRQGVDVFVAAGQWTVLIEGTLP